MKVNIIKEHSEYPLGEVEVTEERGNYLIAVGVAEKSKKNKVKDTNEVLLGDPAPDITELPKEKKEFTPEVEKVEVKAPGKKKK